MKLLICGKGGCGKSTVSALLAMALQKRGKKIFLVDADESNIGLYRMLGLDLPPSLMSDLGGKKGFRKRTASPGIGLGGSPQLFPETMRPDGLPEHCIATKDSIRVMSLGKIHHFGEGCACPMGKLFRLLFSSLTVEDGDIVIVDTAAGVEHFGRSLDKQCDQILCVVDPSYESIMMAQRVSALAKEASLPVWIVLNKVTAEIEKELNQALKDVHIVGCLPDHHSIFLNNLKGHPLDLNIAEIESVCDAIEKAG